MRSQTHNCLPHTSKINLHNKVELKGNWHKIEWNLNNSNSKAR